MSFTDSSELAFLLFKSFPCPPIHSKWYITVPALPRPLSLLSSELSKFIHDWHLYSALLNISSNIWSHAISVHLGLVRTKLKDKACECGLGHLICALLWSMVIASRLCAVPQTADWRRNPRNFLSISTFKCIDLARYWLPSWNQWRVGGNHSTKKKNKKYCNSRPLWNFQDISVHLDLKPLLSLNLPLYHPTHLFLCLSQFRLGLLYTET
jgi:hypothetical protein